MRIRLPGPVPPFNLATLSVGGILVLPAWPVPPPPLPLRPLAPLVYLVCQAGSLVGTSGLVQTDSRGESYPATQPLPGPAPPVPTGRALYCLLFRRGDNPFVAGAGEVRGGQQEIARKVGGWNPFEDTVKFSEVSEDALFGEKVDMFVGCCTKDFVVLVSLCCRSGV